MEEASRLLKGGFISAIRYQWDADMLRDFLGIHVPINREELKLEVGDSAIVIELPELDQSGNVSKVPKCIAMLTRTA